MLDGRARLCRVEENPAHDTYSPALKPLLQSLLSTLADLDFVYERERERLINRVAPNLVVRSRALERLKERHLERCEPYIRHLEAIQANMQAEMQSR
jgi:hypothetical protein